MRLILLITALVFSFNSIGYCQEDEVHSCALSHQATKQLSGQKTLTPTQENDANKYDVHFYKLDLAMSNLVTSLSGTVDMHATSLEPMDSIVLELYPSMVISELRLNGTVTPYNRTASVLKVPINSNANDNFILSIDYAGTPPNPANNPFGGSGVTNAQVVSIGSRVTWTVSCPFLAHEWFPCKQILRDKVDSSEVHVTVPSTCKAGSNGVLQNVVNLGNGTTRYEWFNDRPILYYLISVAIAPYTEYNVYAHPTQLAGDSVLIQNFIYGSASSLSTIQGQCNLLPGFLELYSDLYGLYPFHEQKYGQCVAALSGGMEHQTMTTIGVFEKKTTTHELAHEWWGDHVGIAAFSDVWLSEGFATYSEYLMLEHFYPTEKTALLNGWHTSAYSQLNGSVYNPDTLNINRIYDSRLTYKKGGAIIHTLRNILDNDSLFFQTLQDFQVEFHDSVAYAMDLKNSFELSTGLDLTNFFNEWYFGEGYPTYSARWNTVGNDLLVEITHTASYPSVTPTFTNPLEISFSRTSLPDTTIRFTISTNQNQFLLPNLGDITSMNTIDPENWVINKVGTLVHDTAFVAGINESSLSKLNIYPNPTNGIVLISGISGNYSVIVFDNTGKELKRILDTSEVDLSQFSAGHYLFKVIDENGNSVVKNIVISDL